MSLLSISDANCKNCYKCFRNCSIKSIKVKNEEAEMVNETCIYCGTCLKSCPQGAIKFESDLKLVQSAIDEGKKIVVSLAPSFAGNFDMLEEGQLVTGLKKLGFGIIEETAIGAEVIEELYREYIQEHNKKNIITTSCYSANLLIEKYYPDMIEYMIPLVSPMIGHGKIIKKIYGRDTFVVFIGPCISKKVESIDFQHETDVDAVLTFDEISQWLEEEEIDLKKLESSFFERKSFKTGSGFPLSGNIIKNMFDSDSDEIPYELISVTGIDECKDVLESVQKGELSNVCLELNICKGGCIAGPGTTRNPISYYAREKKVKDYVRKKGNITEDKLMELPEDMNFKKIFVDKSIKRVIADEEKIETILKEMGKYSEEDELNCGTCGYDTCREKAQAIFEGKADSKICLPYMRNKSESLTNVIFEYSPNVIFLLNKELKVLEFNPSAERIFKIGARDIKGKPISMIIDDSDFCDVLMEKENIFAKKIVYSDYNVVLLQNILYLKDQEVLLVIMSNITKEEKQNKELIKVKKNAADAAQNVIDKQMRVAQEIASLLGETTAETKATLTRLKKIALAEDGDIT